MCTGGMTDTVYTPQDTVYTPQKQVATEIVNSFLVKKHTIVTCVAPMQWGKTGVIRKVVELISNPTLCGVKANNVYILTGISDNEWREQTKARLPEENRKNVYHFANMDKIQYTKEQRQEKTLIIIDECHIATRQSQGLSKMFINTFGIDITKSNVSNAKTMILFISATPNNILMDLYHENIRNKVILAPNVKTYTGFTDLCLQNRLLPIKFDYRSERQLKIFFDSMKTYKTPKYHIFRYRKSKKCPTIEQKLEGFCIKYGFHYIYNTSDKRTGNMDSVLKTIPEKHTVIFIKGRWRTSKTLIHDNVGVLVETGKDYNAIVQGLPGRMCGHNRTHDSLIYADMSAIEQYKKLVENDFDYTSIGKWSSSNLKKTRTGLQWRDTYLKKPNSQKIK